MRRSATEDKRNLLTAADTLIRLARDLHTLRQAINTERLGYPTSSGSAPVAGGDPADPVSRLAVALADPDNHTHDQAAQAADRLNRAIDQAVDAARWAHAVYASWEPKLAHVDACANPYGCPDRKPAATKPRRKGLCLACYSWENRHGEHRRRPRSDAA